MEFEPIEYPMDVRLRFEAGQESSPRKLIINTPFLSPVTAEAISTTTLSSPELSSYAGDYWSDELRATYRLSMRDGRLWMVALFGAEGIVHKGTVPFDELRPIITDEFDLKGSPIVIHFLRNAMKDVTGFTLNGFHERGIRFSRSRNAK